MKILKDNKTLLLLIVVIIVSMIAFSGCQPKVTESQNTPLQSNASPSLETPKQQEQVPEDLKGFTEYTIKKQLGEKSNGGKARVKSISVEDSGKESVVTIELNGNDAYIADMTVRGMLMDSKNILEPLSKRQDVAGVSISEYLDVEDIGGGTVEEWVFTLVMDRKGLDRIATGDYMLSDLTEMAVEYKIHPNLK